MRRSLLLALSIAVFSGCIADAGGVGGAADDEDQDDLDTETAGADATSTTLPLRFLPGELFVPSAVIQTEVRKVFRTEAELEAALQMDNPGIDFAHEWAVFYAAGNTNPDLLPGAQTRIETVKVSSTGKTIMVTTALEQNGTGCPTRHTRPFSLVAVPIPSALPALTRFYRADRVRLCSADAYYDGVAFSAAQAEAALRACNDATSTELGDAGITGAQRTILLGGRTWASLAAVAATPNIGAGTMEKLRALGSTF